MDTQPTDAQKKRFLICFSSKDVDGAAALGAHLAPVRGAIKLWSVDEIPAGEQIMPEFFRRAAEADLALLLLSADFFAQLSVETFAKQVEYLRQQHENYGLQLILVLWRDCDWKAEGWLAKLSLLPADGVAIRSTDTAQQDRTLTEIVQALDGRQSTIKSYRKTGKTHLNSWQSFAVISVGLLLLPIAGIGAAVAVSNYRPLFLAIASLGGVYLLFGLFFTNISMFPARQRPRKMLLRLFPRKDLPGLLTLLVHQTYYRHRLTFFLWRRHQT